LSIKRTALTRFPARGRHDDATIHAILDAALLCHIGYVRDGQPFVTPTSFWRVGDLVYWHGSAESSMLRAVGAAIPVCFTVSHVDGVVLSRVLSRHSFNYRSVVALGTARAVTELDEKREGMRRFVERILPGRWNEPVAPVTDAELARITILRMDLREASAKVRAGPPKDDPILAARSGAWAGHVPFKLAVGQAVPSPDLREGVALPTAIASLAERFGAVNLGDQAFAMPAFDPPPSPEAAPAAGATFRLERLDTGETATVSSERTILAGMLDAGMDYPYGCAAGGCAACKTRLVSGTVEHLPHEPAALSPDERSAGWILACRARPASDLAIVPWSQPPGAVQAQILEAEMATHDVLRLRVAPARPVGFIPGQFMRLAVAGLPAREYSPASQPGGGPLEFHIRVMPGGEVTPRLATMAAPGLAVTLHGPFGIAGLRAEDPAPILAMAGGTGLAPVLSIVEAALALRPLAAVTLYFGVREERDLYDLDRLSALAARHPNFRCIPVLSAARATTRRTGFLADALARDAPPLAGVRLYLAGPPVMVESCTQAALRLGADPGRIHADAFTTAADRIAS